MHICKNCTYFRIIGNVNRHVWYCHYCTHPKVALKAVTHPQTGEKGFESQNDFGDKVYGDCPYPYARAINPAGECKLFRSAVVALV